MWRPAAMPVTWVPCRHCDGAEGARRSPAPGPVIVVSPFGQLALIEKHVLLDDATREERVRQRPTPVSRIATAWPPPPNPSAFGDVAAYERHALSERRTAGHLLVDAGHGIGATAARRRPAGVSSTDAAGTLRKRCTIRAPVPASVARESGLLRADLGSLRGRGGRVE